MAKAEAKCTCKKCGNTFYVRVDGHSRREADSKAEWASGWYDECPDCRAARKEKEREDYYEAASKRDYPDLTGSEKQIKWAITLRAKRMDQLEKIKNNVAKKELFADFMAWIAKEHTNSAWWIDHRFENIEVFYERETAAYVAAHPELSEAKNA